MTHDAGNNLTRSEGVEQVVPAQMGFPVELTSAWDATTGYSWKRLTLVAVTVGNPTLQQVGDRAVTPDNDHTLLPGRRGWLEPEAGRIGWIFISCGAGGPAPQPPQGLQATAGDSEAFLTWSPPPGAPSPSTYLVYYSTSADMANPTFFTQTPSTSATVTGLVNGTTYYFAVVAVYNGARSGYSNIDDARPPGTPDCPDLPEFLPFTVSTPDIGSGNLARIAPCDGSGASWTHSTGATACSPVGGVDITLTVNGAGEWSFSVQDDGDTYTGTPIFDSLDPLELRIVYTAGPSSCGGPGEVTITVTE